MDSAVYDNTDCRLSGSKTVKGAPKDSPLTIALADSGKKKRTPAVDASESFLKMVGDEGLEPPTTCV